MNFKDEVIQSFETLREMIRDRAVHDPHYRNLAIDQISERELEDLATRQLFSIDLSDEIRVIYNLANRNKLPEIKKFISNDEHTHILILREKLTGTNLKSLATLKDLQVFELKELMFNISKHRLVPKHTVINDEAKIQEILDTYKVKLGQLPHILKTDAMARYLAIKPGNLVKIERPSPSAGEYVCYRCCV